MPFFAFYKDPAKQCLQRMEIAALVLILPVLLFLGVHAYTQYLAFLDAEAHIARADELTHAGRIQEALAELEQCVASYPELYEAYEMMAALTYDKRDRSRAIAAYRRGLVSLPDHGELHYSLAQMLYLDKDYSGALSHARRASDLLPGDPRSASLVENCQRRSSRT